MREYIGNVNEELKDFVDDIVPFKSTHTHNLVTILNEQDIRDSGYYTEKSVLGVKNNINNKIPAQSE